jgi:endonuclease/exonuclease/phosphatase family metal-dependent hydrolase
MSDDPLFSFASWNVQNFFGEPERIDRCVEFLRAANPDVFALYEVKGADVFEALTSKMSDHSFFIEDLHLSTLQSYIHALGGRVEIDVVMGDQRVPLVDE